jgi:hypothetical protein
MRKRFEQAINLPPQQGLTNQRSSETPTRMGLHSLRSDTPTRRENSLIELNFPAETTNQSRVAAMENRRLGRVDRS